MATHRLTSRKLTENDTADYHLLTGDHDVMRYILGHSYSPEESKREVRRLVEQFGERPDAGIWVFHHNNTREFVGVGGLIPLEEDAMEIGFRVFKPFWGQGYGSEICARLIQIAGRHRKERIIGVVETENTYSIKILEKHGFEKTNENEMESGGRDYVYELVLDEN